MLQMLYGPIRPSPAPTPELGILTFLLSSTFVIASLVVGSVLFLITHKKIFIIIPLILGSLFLVSKILGLIFGID